MSPPREQPDFVPDIAWRAALGYLQREAWEGTGERATVERLMGDPGLKNTWRNLSKKLSSDRQWTLLLGLLSSFPSIVREDLGAHLRDAMKRADNLSHEKIYNAAHDLADFLEEHGALCERHSIEAPDEFGDLQALIRDAYGRWRGKRHPLRLPGPETVETKYQIPLPFLLRRLAAVADSAEARPSHEEFDAFADGRSGVAACVRLFDEISGRYWARHFPHNFRIGSADLAHLFGCMFGRDVAREAVVAARRRSRKAEHFDTF